MSVSNIVNALEDLVEIHHQLAKISEEKTTLIKEGRIDEFQQLILTERKRILTLEQAETKRQKAVEQWFYGQGRLNEEMTITNMLELITDEQDQTSLATVATQLTEAITSLKRQEQLNQELLEQSMQFVQMSLNMLSPSINQMNYGEKKQSNQRNRSVFDSRA